MLRIPSRNLDSVIKLASLQNFLFDCDGVLWHDTKLIDGAKDVLHKLKDLGKNIFLVTNNSLKTRKEYAEKCKNLGLQVEENEIVCTSYIAAQYMKDTGFEGKVYIVGPPSLATELNNVGIANSGIEGPPPVSDLFKWDYKSLKLDPEITGVLVGFDQNINYTKIMKAASYIYRGATFFATNEDAQLPLPDSQLIRPGTGSIVASVRIASNKTPIVVGKPHSPMFEVLVKNAQLDPANSIMIGDRLETDILFGNQHGMFTGVVMTGITTPVILDQAINGTEENMIPHYQLNTVKDLLLFL